MPRAKRDIVPYFPHYAKPGGGKTKRLLFKEFGHAGKSCWFELLEVLADSDGHFLDLREDINWLDLVETLQVEESTAESLLNYLVRLGKLDADLWNHRIVWCQNLVNRLEYAYAKRKRSIPEKPFFGRNGELIVPDSTPWTPKTDISGTETDVSGTETGDSVAEMPTRKEKKSIEKKSKQKHTESPTATMPLLNASDALNALRFQLQRYSRGDKKEAAVKIADKLCSKFEPSHIITKLEHFQWVLKYRPELAVDPGGYLVKSIETPYPAPAGYDDFLASRQIMNGKH